MFIKRLALPVAPTSEQLHEDCEQPQIKLVILLRINGDFNHNSSEENLPEFLKLLQLTLFMPT